MSSYSWSPIVLREGELGCGGAVLVSQADCVQREGCRGQTSLTIPCGTWWWVGCPGK